MISVSLLAQNLCASIRIDLPLAGVKFQMCFCYDWKCDSRYLRLVQFCVWNISISGLETASIRQ